MVSEEQDMKEVADATPDFMKTDDEALLEKIKEPPYVSYVDMYYRGVHVGKTFRHFSENTVDAQVEDYINRNLATEDWKPSWKEEANKPSTQSVSQPREFVKKIEPSEDGEIRCTIHGEKMYPKQGKFGNYFSHGWQENGYWMNCSGKGAKQGRPVS